MAAPGEAVVPDHELDTIDLRQHGLHLVRAVGVVPATVECKRAHTVHVVHRIRDRLEDVTAGGGEGAGQGGVVSGERPRVAGGKDDSPAPTGGEPGQCLAVVQYRVERRLGVDETAVRILKVSTEGPYGGKNLLVRRVPPVRQAECAVRVTIQQPPAVAERRRGRRGHPPRQTGRHQVVQQLNVGPGRHPPILAAALCSPPACRSRRRQGPLLRLHTSSTRPIDRVPPLTVVGVHVSASIGRATRAVPGRVPDGPTSQPIDGRRLRAWPVVIAPAAQQREPIRKRHLSSGWRVP